MRSKIAHKILERTPKETKTFVSFYAEIIASDYLEDMESKKFNNLGELSPEEYCLKIGKQIFNREIEISTKEFFIEIKRYFNENSKDIYILMDIVKHFVSLYKN